MHIRPVRSIDIPYLSTIAASAFANDELFAVLNPGANKYPEDWRQYLLSRLRLRSSSPGFHTLVCVSDEKDSDWLPARLASDEAHTSFGRLGAEADRSDGYGEVLLGYVIWRHEGPAEDPAVRFWGNPNTDPFTRMNVALYKLQDRYVDFFGMNRSADVEQARKFRSFVEEFDPYAPMERPGRPGYWCCRSLAVSPIARRKGAGKALMTWGLEHAEREGVPACVVSSVIGENLYRSLGFLVIDEGEEKVWGPSLIWDPERKWTRTLQEGEEGAIVERGEERRKCRMDVAWKD